MSHIQAKETAGGLLAIGVLEPIFSKLDATPPITNGSSSLKTIKTANIVIADALIKPDNVGLEIVSAEVMLGRVGNCGAANQESTVGAASNGI